MTVEERARKLLAEGREYHLKDAQWKVNFRTRVRRLALTICPKTDIDQAMATMCLDHIAIRTGISLVWKEEPA